MNMENLQIVTSPGAHEGQKTLVLKGPLTIHTVFGFQDAIRREAAPELILDLGGVPYVDSAGLGALVGAYVGAQKAKRKLALVGLNNRVKTLAEMTHVMQLFQCYASVKEAEAAFSQSK